MADWRHHAACRGVDPETFFPIARRGTPAYDVDVLHAKRVCRRCPVVAECLTSALDRGDDDAVIGGTTPDERRLLRTVLASGQPDAIPAAAARSLAHA